MTITKKQETTKAMTKRQPLSDQAADGRPLVEFPLVPITVPDLRFRLGVESELADMFSICKKKRRTYRTPEFQRDARDNLERLMDEYADALPKPEWPQTPWVEPEPEAAVETREVPRWPHIEELFRP